MQWGLLGPEQLAESRRTRTLGLGAAVRTVNHLAVPGLGGVWFAKQTFLATLGVQVADMLRSTSINVKAIEIANAIEALACWCASRTNHGTRDAFCAVVRDLVGKEDLTFSRLSQPGIYVTQRMRMATVEALVNPGFVHADSWRYNSFRCAQAGEDLIEAATAQYEPYTTTVEKYLFKRAKNNTSISDTYALQEALTPLVVLGRDARVLLREKLCEGAGLNPSAARMKNALAWIGSIDSQLVGLVSSHH